MLSPRPVHNDTPRDMGRLILRTAILGPIIVRPVVAMFRYSPLAACSNRLQLRKIRQLKVTFDLVHALESFVLDPGGSRPRLRRVYFAAGKQGRERGLEDGSEHRHARVQVGQGRLGDAPKRSPDHRVWEIEEVDGGKDADADDGDRGDTATVSGHAISY